MSYTSLVKNIVFIEEQRMTDLNKWLLFFKKIYQGLRNLIILGIMFRLLFLDTERLGMLKPIIIETIGALL